MTQTERRPDPHVASLPGQMPRQERDRLLIVVVVKLRHSPIAIQALKRGIPLARLLEIAGRGGELLFLRGDYPEIIVGIGDRKLKFLVESLGLLEKLRRWGLGRTGKSHIVPFGKVPCLRKLVALRVGSRIGGLIGRPLTVAKVLRDLEFLLAFFFPTLLQQ